MKIILKNARIGIGISDIQDCTDKEKLKQWMLELEKDIFKIDAEIDRAIAMQKTTGKYLDPIQFSGLKNSKRVQGILKNAIQTRLSEINNKSRPFSEFIVDALKIRVPEDEFNSIIEDAKILERRFKNKVA